MQSDDSRDGKPLGAPLEGAGGEAADDDLDSLAGSLGSIHPPHPPDAAHEADDVDLKALSVLSSRSSTVSHAPEDAPPPAAPSAAPPRAALDAEPVSAQPSRRNTWLGPLLVGLGLGVGAAGLAFGLASRQQPAGTAAAASPAAAPVAQPGPPPTPEPSPVAALAAVVGAPPATGSPAALESARPLPEPERVPAAARSSASGADRRAPLATDAAPIRMGSPAPAAVAPAGPVLALRPVAEGPAPALAPAAAPQAGAKRGTSVDELLDQALASPERAAALRQEQAAAMEQDALPETPSREAVTKAMTTMLPAISGCAMGHAGLATATIVVRGDGRVASAEVAGAPFAGSASGRCMEGVIRRTAFPRFRQPVFRIKYPLSIQ